MIDYTNEYGVKLSQEVKGHTYLNSETIEVKYYVDGKQVSYWVDLGDVLEYETLDGKIVRINKA